MKKSIRYSYEFYIPNALDSVEPVLMACTKKNVYSILTWVYRTRGIRTSTCNERRMGSI